MINLKPSQILRLNKKEIKNKRIILRVDYNLNLKNKAVEDIYRIKKSLPTIKFLLKNQARQIILVTHLGQPSKIKEKKLSTKNLLPLIKKLIKKDIYYYFWQPSRKNYKIPLHHSLILLENIRFFKEEMDDDPYFAYQLSQLGEIYVNEAFSVSHRKHASLHKLSKILPTFYGLNFETEIKNLNLVFKTQKKIAIIIGGIKIETKLPLIKSFLNKAQLIILVGGIANTFLKAKGFEVGQSIVDDHYLNELKKIISYKILLPFDFFTPQGYKYLGQIKKNDIIYDIGPQSINNFIDELKKNQLIIWNGPLGFIENKKYSLGSKFFSQKLARLKAYKIAGGGETLSLIHSLKLSSNFNFISTGGGAMLYYLAYKNLPIFD
jgi:phosphoglycerate kinase